MCCPRTSAKNKCIKNGIDHQDVSTLWRLCKAKVESASHFASLCSVLAGNQYRKKYSKLGKNVHWLLCKKFESECKYNGTRISQSHCKKMRNLKYFGTLQCRQIRKYQALYLKRRENAKSST